MCFYGPTPGLQFCWVFLTQQYNNFFWLQRPLLFKLHSIALMTLAINDLFFFGERLVFKV